MRLKHFFHGKFGNQNIKEEKTKFKSKTLTEAKAFVYFTAKRNNESWSHYNCNGNDLTINIIVILYCCITLKTIIFPVPRNDFWNLNSFCACNYFGYSSRDPVEQQLPGFSQTGGSCANTDRTHKMNTNLCRNVGVLAAELPALGRQL